MMAVGGEWKLPASSEVVVDPLNGSPFLRVPDTKANEVQPFVDSLRACPKSGLHNPIKVGPPVTTTQRVRPAVTAAP